MRVKRGIICVMEKGNIFTQMGAITLATGSRGKCKAQGNCLISKATFSTRVNGETIILKVEESSTIILMEISGTNMRVSLDLEIVMVLANYFIKMATGSKVSLGTI